MKTATLANYAKRIEKVVMYLSDHLDDTLDLHRLAEEAHLSPYHFHRVYVAMMGETVAETVRRQRLHRASIKLLVSATPVAKLATEAGYGSVQAFNRSFREAYGLPPGVCLIGCSASLLKSSGTVTHASERNSLAGFDLGSS